VKYIASVSFGKDSLAMLLLLLEHKMPLDKVIFYDTGMEFDAIYQTRNKAVKLLEQHGIKYTELHPPMKFEDRMYNYPYISRRGEQKQGYGWCGGLCRWGTKEKTMALDKYCKAIGEEVRQYVGIALDEPQRLERLKGTNKISPLAEFGFTEPMALEHCYKHGFDWLETKGGADPVRLYDILDRVSCWCCRNKNLKELANYKRYLPAYFKRLEDLEQKIGEPMKKPIYLSKRFAEVKNENS
jgi:3'-phosphoadenosine 5'-phosphosulfate sulfotransferase (PAPS reductase)/FAD synthetase